jgi:hypothetical protein
MKTMEGMQTNLRRRGGRGETPSASFRGSGVNARLNFSDNSLFSKNNRFNQEKICQFSGHSIAGKKGVWFSPFSR